MTTPTPLSTGIARSPHPSSALHFPTTSILPQTASTYFPHTAIRYPPHLNPQDPLKDLVSLACDPATQQPGPVSGWRGLSSRVLGLAQTGSAVVGVKRGLGGGGGEQQLPPRAAWWLPGIRVLDPKPKTLDTSEIQSVWEAEAGGLPQG